MIGKTRLSVYSTLAWIFGATLPTLFTSLLPLMTHFTFPDGYPLARPSPPTYPSISYYICNSSASGTFALFLYPGVFLMWWILGPLELKREFFVLMVHALSLWGVFYFPHVSFNSVHGFFTGLLIGSSVTYTLFLCIRLRERGEKGMVDESLSEKRERTVVYSLFGSQLLVSLILGIARILIATGRDVGMFFFGCEVAILGLVSSVVPSMLTVRAMKPVAMNHRTNLFL
jgi:hypothetical protein